MGKEPRWPDWVFCLLIVGPILAVAIVLVVVAIVWR